MPHYEIRLIGLESTRARIEGRRRALVVLETNAILAFVRGKALGERSDPGLRTRRPPRTCRWRRRPNLSRGVHGLFRT